MLLGINSPATADEETLDPTKGDFSRPSGLGIPSSTCGWRLGGLSMGIFMLYPPWSYTFSLSMEGFPTLCYGGRLGWQEVDWSRGLSLLRVERGKPSWTPPQAGRIAEVVEERAKP